MEIITIITLLLGHWISDYIFQSTSEVSLKGYNNSILIRHCVSYTTAMTFIVYLLILLNVLNQSLWFFIINFWIITFTFHYIVDYLTSKISIEAWNSENKSNYFSVIITDQIIHLIILFLTIFYLFV